MTWKNIDFWHLLTSDRTPLWKKIKNMYSLNLIISSKLLRLRSITEQKSKRRFSGSLVLGKLTSKYFCMNENGINTSLSASAYKQSMSSFLFGRPIFFLTS